METITSSKKNSLIVSQRFTSYIEKHRIFQLFQELSSMMLIKRPDDHVLFLKQSLQHAARRLDVPRIIILASPNCDKLQLAQNLQKKLNIPLITLNDIHDHPESIILSATNNAMENLRVILINYMKVNCDGWIFLDFPRNEKEARFLLRSGIIPTHVIEIIETDSLQISENPLEKEYYNELRGLRHVFSSFLMKINGENREIEDITEKCLSLIKSRKYSRPPTLMRIALIDATDSNICKDLGRYIAEVFNVIHIHFSDIVEQMSLQDTKLGNKVREILDGSAPTLPPDVKIEIFEDFLSRSAALKQGWILTDLPSTVEDFKHLDMTDFPPNRVIVIVNPDFNLEEDNITCNIQKDCVETISSLAETDNVCQKEEKGEKGVMGIVKYAGKTATFLKKADDLKIIKERIDYLLMQPPANVPARVPRQATCVKFEDIEYDPDDQPCTEQLKSIRNPEPTVNLI